MKMLTQFEIPAHQSGPVLSYRREPHDASNDTGRTIPADHVVGVRVENGALRIVSDLGKRQ
jgi:hypothetical protein